MRKIISLFLLLLVLLNLGVVAKRDPLGRPILDMTEVVVVLPTKVCGNSTCADLKDYMHARISEPFRLPYYTLLPTTEFESFPANKVDFERIAVATGADIVVLPQIVHWNQNTFKNFYRDDTYVRTSCVLRVLTYEKGANRINKTEQRYFNTQSESVLTNPRQILHDMMDLLMEKYPYKRIPAQN